MIQLIKKNVEIQLFLDTVQLGMNPDIALFL